MFSFSTIMLTFVTNDWLVSGKYNFHYNFTYFSYIFLYLAILTTYFIHNLIQKDTGMDFFNTLNQLHDTTVKYFGKLDYDKDNMFLVYLILIHLTLFTYFGIDCCAWPYMVSGDIWIFTHYILLYLIIATTIKYVSLIAGVGNALSLLQAALIQYTTFMEKCRNVEKIYILIDGYEKIFFLVNCINNIFGVFILLLYFIYIIHFVKIFAILADVGIHYFSSNYTNYSETIAILSLLGSISALSLYMVSDKNNIQGVPIVPSLRL